MAVDFRVGDARDVLASLDEQSVHCCVTSPPYWGLRSYQGDEGMIGLEPTFDDHLANLLAVFREVRRVLRDDGTLWLNYGDAYVGGGRGQGGTNSKQPTNKGSLDDQLKKFVAHHNLKPKNLMMMPARVALAMQEDGWFLRSEIVWAKPNPMPESTMDRPTSAHEKIFLLTKKPKYFYDQMAVRTPLIKTGTSATTGWHDSPYYHGQNPDKPKKPDKQRGHSRRHDGFNKRWDHMTKAEQQAMGANMRNVMNVATYPYHGAHFATFPPDLIIPFIKAGTSEHGVCRHCGAQYKRNTPPKVVKHPEYHADGKVEYRDVDVEWEPTCECTPHRVKPATVLDPFGGSGTVGLVADQLGRSAILIDISGEYMEMAKQRLREDAPLLTTEEA